MQFFNPRPTMPKPSHHPARIPLPTPPSLPARPSFPVTPFRSSRTTQSPSCQLLLNSCFQSTTPIHNIPGLPRKPTQQPKKVLQGTSRDNEPQDLSSYGPEEYRPESRPVAIAPRSSAPVQAPTDRPNPQTAFEARDSHCDRVPGESPSFERLQNEKGNKNSKSLMGYLVLKLMLTKR